MKKATLLLFAFLAFACASDGDREIENAMEILRKSDKKLGVPQPGDWLFQHHDKHQTLADYKAAKPVSPTKSRNVIYLQPIGNFSETQQRLIDYTADYLEIFYGLKTVTLKAMGNDVFPKGAKRIGFEGNEQVLAPYVLDSILKKSKPADAIAYMAITEKDLYPEPTWNYVFGLSSFEDNVGVTSIFRLQEVEDNENTLCLNRLIKIASHEMGHIFTMYHCTNAVCTMNGSNGLFETDKQPNRLCSECTGKLLWNHPIKHLERLKQLKAYFAKHHLDADFDNISADVKLAENDR